MEFLLVFVLVLGVAYLWFVMKKDTGYSKPVNLDPVVESKPVVEVVEVNAPLVTPLEEPTVVKKVRKPRASKVDKAAKTTKKSKTSKV